MSRLSDWSWRFRGPLLAALAFVVAFDVAFLWQRYGGAYRSEFGGHPDEAAHYVTGLMIRDYVAAGVPGSPMPFANEYYRHYPKVALGVWPPFFYVVQSAWTLVFGVNHTSMLLLMAALAALVACQLFGALREEFGWVLAVLAAVFLLSLPLFRGYYSMIMAETLCAALMFGAALKFGRYLDEERPRDALCFGFLAGLAILTKGTGMALALVAPVALALAGQWRLLTRPALWAGAAITAILAGPWTWYFRNTGREKGGWLESSPSWNFMREASSYYAGKLGLAVGVIFLVLLCVGLFVQLLRPAQRRGRWAAAGALIFGVLVFQCILPVGLEDRHLISLLPAAMMFVVAGFVAVCRRVSARKSPQEPADPAVGRVGHIAFALIGILSVASSQMLDRSTPDKHWSGFAEIAEAILEADRASKSIVLVSSDARGEGMFISELAMREKRPGHVVQRASKVLATMEWSGRNARPRFDNEDDLLAFFATGDIDYVVVDDSIPNDKRGSHHELLYRTAVDHPERFWPMASSAVIRGGETFSSSLRAYRVKHRN